MLKSLVQNDCLGLKGLIEVEGSGIGGGCLFREHPSPVYGATKRVSTVQQNRGTVHNDVRSTQSTSFVLGAFSAESR